MRPSLLKYLQIVLFVAIMPFVSLADVEKRNFTLVIDAGHGGHDAGAVGAYSKEKDINLKVALAFGRLVENNCPDVKVVYTRKTDVFIPLQRRADIANNNKADLLCRYIPMRCLQDDRLMGLKPIRWVWHVPMPTWL